MDAALFFGKKKTQNAAVCYVFQPFNKVFPRKMQSLLLAVSKNARVPCAPKNVLIASLSTLVLPCLRSDFSFSLPFTGLGLHGFLPLHSHPVLPAMTLALWLSFLHVSGICNCGNGGGKGN